MISTGTDGLRPLVGVALIVRKWTREGWLYLLHKRLSKHGNKLWAFSGGHLEWGESFEDCSSREGKEEFGNDIQFSYPKYFTTLNTLFPKELKHYVVIFMISEWISGEARVAEPDKCECWEWFLAQEIPDETMPGIKHLRDTGMLT